MRPGLNLGGANLQIPCFGKMDENMQPLLPCRNWPVPCRAPLFWLGEIASRPPMLTLEASWAVLVWSGQGWELTNLFFALYNLKPSEIDKKRWQIHPSPAYFATTYYCFIARCHPFWASTCTQPNISNGFQCHQGDWIQNFTKRGTGRCKQSGIKITNQHVKRQGIICAYKFESLTIVTGAYRFPSSDWPIRTHIFGAHITQHYFTRG